MFVIRLVLCLLVIITADGLEDIKDVRQHLSSNYVNQRLDSSRMISHSLSRKKRQSVIRNSQPGQNPQVRGIELSPSVFIYVENEKDLESLLTNQTLDDIINTAERNIQSNTKTQYPMNTMTNGRNPQYQQQNQQIPSFMNYNTQGVYKSRNAPAPATTETVLLSYDQLSSYLPQGSTILNDNNQNDKIFIQVDENIKFPQDILLPVTKMQPKIMSNNTSLERDNSFRYPSTQESKDHVYSNINRSASPKGIPLSISSIMSQEDFRNDGSFAKSIIPNGQTNHHNTDIKTEPGTREMINRDEVQHDRKIPNGYNANTKNNDENAPRDSNEQRDDTNYDSKSLNNDSGSLDYDRRPPNSDRRPPDYGRRPYDYDRRPSDYGRRPPDYDRRPPYDRWNGGWDRRPNYGRGEPSYGWRPPPHGRGPPHKGGPPPYGRGRGPPQKDPPYVINLNFDSKTPNGNLLNDNGTITENSNGQEQNPYIYETLKSIFNPKPGEALVGNDAKQPHEQSTVPGLFQVSPVTPAA